MSANDPYGPPPGPWGQGGSAPGPSGPGQPYAYPPPPPAQAPGSGYAFGPFAPPGGGAGPPTTPTPGAPPPTGGRGRLLIVLGVVALALILVGVGAAVLVRNRAPGAGPGPVPSTNSGPGSSSAPPSSAPPAALASDAVRGYLEALAAGDADAALAYASAAVQPGPYMTDQVLAASVKRAPITAIDVPVVDDSAAIAVAARYVMGKTPVTAEYGVQQVGGVWKLSAVAKTVDLGLVRPPSLPIRINGVTVKSDFVDLLPGAYAFTAASPLLTLGDKAVILIKDPNDYANVLDLRLGLSANGRKTVVGLAKKSYGGCLQARVAKPKNCPFAWNDTTYRYRSGSVRWRQSGSDPFTKAKTDLSESSASVVIPLKLRISGPCTYRGSSGTCTGTVTGTGVASVRLNKSKLSVSWVR